MVKFSYKYIFYLIVFLAFVVRIYFVFFTNFGWYGCDSDTYLKMGKAILDGEPISYFPNGYPLLVALVTLISTTYAPTVLVIINIVVQILTLFLAERILSQFGLADKVKLLAVFLIAFYPNQLSRVRFIMTEPLSVFLMMLSIYLFFNKKYLLTGFISYLTYAFRPSLLLFSPLLIIYQLYKRNKSSAGRIALGFALGIVVFVLTDVVGLTAPSGNQTQNILVSIQSYGYNINHSFSNYSKEQIEYPVRTYYNFVATHPINYIEQRIMILWALWGPYVPTDLGVFANLLHGLRFPFFILSLITFFFRKRFGKIEELIFILFLPVLSLTAVHLHFFANQRHTFAAEPFVVILSVIGVSYFIKKLVYKKHSVEPI